MSDIITQSYIILTRQVNSSATDLARPGTLLYIYTLDLLPNPISEGNHLHNSQ